MAKKTIRIACEGATLIELDSFEPFQGDLKVLSEEAYERGKKSILELGFSFPMNAWKDKKKIKCIDAHGRRYILLRMRDEGYLIPKLPTNWVHAANEQEAAKKVLAASAPLGQITADGLHNYMQEHKLQMDFVIERFEFPEINLPQFAEAYGYKQNETHEVTFKAKAGAKELDEGEFSDFDHVCPKCKFQWNDNGKKKG